MNEEPEPAEWVVHVENDLDTEELCLALNEADSGSRGRFRQTFEFVGGLRIDILAHEHPPPHFRVVYNGESNNFSLRDCTPLDGDGLKRHFKRIRKWFRVHKPMLIERWNRFRPTGCPVGKYTE